MVWVPVQVQRQENQEHWWFKFQFKDRGGLMAQISLEVEMENSLFPCLFILFRPLLIEWSPPTLEKLICFTKSTDSNADVVQKHPHRQTQKQRLTLTGHSVAWSSWHIKLTITSTYTHVHTNPFLDNSEFRFQSRHHKLGKTSFYLLQRACCCPHTF